VLAEAIPNRHGDQHDAHPVDIGGMGIRMVAFIILVVIVCLVLAALSYAGQDIGVDQR
jgi:hypothetical protein